MAQTLQQEKYCAGKVRVIANHLMNQCNICDSMTTQMEESQAQ